MLYVEEDMSIHLTRGDTAILSLDIDDEIKKEKYEIAEGDKIYFTVKKTVYDVLPVIQKVIEEEATIMIKPEDTQDLGFGKYKYDVELVKENGDTFTVIVPTTFELMKEVTY